MKKFYLIPLILTSFLVSAMTLNDPSNSIYPLEGVNPPVYYAAQKPVTDGDNGELAVIVIHGWGGGPGILHEVKALQESLGGIYVVSPLFPRSQIMRSHKIELDGRDIWNESWPRDLTQPGLPDDDWRGGGDANGTQLSSYDVIDTLLSKFSDKRLYPNLKRIALVGFSAGGQFVGRYVAVGKGLPESDIEMIYAAMAPSTQLIPDSGEIWHYGLKNRPRYSLNLGDEQIMENLRTRRCFYACGLRDTLERDLDKTPPAMRQGKNRYIRFLNFKSMVESDSLWKANSTFHVFESLGHQAYAAYADSSFLDFVLK